MKRPRAYGLELPPRPPFWHPGDAIAIVVALALFAIICGGRCG